MQASLAEYAGALAACTSDIARLHPWVLEVLSS